MPEPTDDIRAFLAERRYATLATQNRDGTIHLTPVWFLFDGERFCFESFSGSRKVNNLRRNPTASVVVDARPAGRERWVSASGSAEIIGGDEAQAMNSAIRRRYLTPEALDDSRIEPAFAASDDVTIMLVPTSWRSWSAEDLDAQFFGGILGATPERWFLPLDV